MARREHWGTRFGFIMATAGSAVGLGNVWKFPYMAGEEGGGAFLILYLGFILVFGLSLMLAELLIGRSTQKNPVGAFRELAGGLWPLAGMLGIITAFLVLSYYIVVAGWTLAYIALSAEGAIHSTDGETVRTVFQDFVGDPVAPLACAALFMTLTAIVVAGGIGAGIERTSKLFMPLLFVLLLILVVRAVTLPGAGEGIAFYLRPDWSKVGPDTFVGAIGQAFFSLSLGLGALITYGSYMTRDDNLAADAGMITGLDTLIAFLAGLVILPAVFAAGVAPDQGPALTFITLPTVFAQMPAGQIFSTLFFVLLAIAALTSAVSLLEVIVTYIKDEHGLRRHSATLLAAVITSALAVPSALSMGLWSGFTVNGQDFLTFADTLATSVLMPGGAFVTALFVGWKLGPKAISALTQDGRHPIPGTGLWLFMLRFVCPLGILWIALNGLGVV
ncbi:sodium:neurotransmitter symporter [Salinisphaera sp. PC39]|uniref:sodium-dependent transporter n=1 Tax=Salinisphaera sp. PC39 TaxID=1304156 RepID=UPI003341D88D